MEDYFEWVNMENFDLGLVFLKDVIGLILRFGFRGFGV
jgi:hypothetical protein